MYKHGPVAVSLMVEGDFGTDPYGPRHEYNDYNSSDPSRHFFFTEVNHEVLIIGWTTLESGFPAWIV